MLHSIELENFKAFGERVQIPLGRITLLFGQNSAGKTAILQALALMKYAGASHSFNGEVDTHSFLPGDGSGGFRELVFDHDTSRPLCVRISSRIRYDLYGSMGFREDARVGSGSVEWQFRGADDQLGTRVDKVDTFVDGLDAPVVSFRSLSLSESASSDVYAVVRQPHYHARRDDVRYDQYEDNVRAMAVCDRCELPSEYWIPAHNAVQENRLELAEAFEEMHDTTAELLADPDWTMEDAWEWPVERDTMAEFRSAVADRMYFYANPSTLEDFIERSRREELTRVADFDGILLDSAGRLLTRPTGPVLDDVGHPHPSSVCDGFFAHVAGRVGMGVFDAARFTRGMQKAVLAPLSSLFWLGEIRADPQRIYRLSSVPPHDVGRTGEHVAAYLYHHPDVVATVNEWFDKLKVGYHVDVRSLGPQERGYVELRLLDTQRDTPTPLDVSLADVGYGVGQLLPIVTQALSQRDETIAIQQPEVHVHPALQADLADLFIHCAKPTGPYEGADKQFIIETHSEHLVLRMQRRIREGTLNPDDLVILYVRRGTEGSQVRRIRLAEDGDFLDEWPGGFFPERLRELL
jgi:hypothetical protein